jgi:hypothetical protein
MAIGKLELQNRVYTFIFSRFLPPAIEILDLASGPLLDRGWLPTIVGRAVLRIEGRAFVGFSCESSAREPLGHSISKDDL